MKIEDLQPRICSLKSFIKRLMILSFISQFPSQSRRFGTQPRCIPSSLPTCTCGEGLSSSCLPLPAQVLVSTLLIGWARGQAAALGAPVPNALNGHDTTLNFRFSATAGETSAGRDLGPVTASSAVATSLPVIRHHLEPAALQCQSSVDSVTVPCSEHKARYKL